MIGLVVAFVAGVVVMGLGWIVTHVLANPYPDPYVPENGFAMRHQLQQSLKRAPRR